MKRLLLVMAFAFAGAFAANAQCWMGGNMSFWYNDGSTKFSIAPEIGYSFHDNPVSLATGFGYHYHNYENDLGNVVTTHTFVLSPYVRCNLAYVDQFAFFLDGGADMAFLNDGMAWRAGLRPGIAFSPTGHWTAVAHMGFLGFDDGEYFGEKGFGMNFSAAVMNLGLYYNF